METESRRFTKIDESFVCAHCGKEVLPLGYSSRNHCPFCLWSLHLDVNPGDRAANCGGALEPIRVEIDSKKGYVIVHKCKKCGAIRRNRTAHEAKVQPDDLKRIIRLTVADF